MKNLFWILLIFMIVSCSYSNQINYTSKDDIRKQKPTTTVLIFEEPPRAIKTVPPVYPQIAKSKGIEGEVWLEVEVFEDGTVGTVEVTQSLMPGPNGLDEAAVNCVKQWVFSPANIEGKPVVCWITFPIRFSLN